MQILHDGQALLVADEQINVGVLNMYPNLKVIGCPMTGLDHIDLWECRRRGIEVISLGYAGEREKEVNELLDDVTSTAEHTIGLIIALLRNYKMALNSPYRHRDHYVGHSLKGKKLLLIGGAGRVGRQVHRMAEGLGMEVFVTDRAYQENRIVKWLGKLLKFNDEFTFEKHIEMILPKFDIVSVHIPLPLNEGFFTKQMFECMKNTAYFINTSRSGVVEKGALLYALQNRLIAGAAVDFIDDEKLVEYAMGGWDIVLTNHIAGVTYEDRKKTADFIKSKVDAYINQLNIINNLNNET